MNRTSSRLFLLICIILSICLTSCGSDSSDNTSTKKKETPEITIASSVSKSEKEAIVTSSIDNSSQSTSKEAESGTEELSSTNASDIENETTSDDEPSESEDETADLPFNYIESFKIAYETDHAHCDNEVPILGNNEKLTIELKASPAGLKADDFIFGCSEDELSYSIEEVTDDQSKDETHITLYVRSVCEGYHTFVILPVYDYVMYEEDDWSLISLDIHGLNSEDGRIVYITRTGEKYHYSEECAGVNAYSTTLFDVKAFEMEPCGKCVH